LEELRKTTKDLSEDSGVWAEILTRYFPNTEEEF
jgi:hypothetical protein